MRQLRLKPQSLATPEAQTRHAAEWAEAAQALAALPVPPHLPPALQAAFGPAGQQPLLSIAKQYQQQGLPPLELVRAGHSALVAFAGRWAELPEKARADWAWWVRQGVVGAVAEKN